MSDVTSGGYGRGRAPSERAPKAKRPSQDKQQVDAAVAAAVDQIHRYTRARTTVARPKLVARKPAIHDLVTQPRRKATPIVTEHTRGQANAVDRNLPPTPFQGRTGPVQGPHPDFVAGLVKGTFGPPLGQAHLLVTHPGRALFPPGPPNAANLPLSQQQLSEGVIPWGPVKGLFGRAEVPEAPVEGPPPTPEQQVRAKLRGAKIVRGKQEVGYTAERSARAQEINRIMQENPGIEGHHQALAALRGELPKINFGTFKELTPDALDALAKHIHEHPHLMPYQKITAVRALENATEGKVPTHSEIRLLTNIFGKDTVSGLQKIHTLPDHLKNAVLELLNVPRSLMASFDLSAPFRQGLMAGARHPVIFGRNFKPMIRSFGKEGVYQQIEQEIASRPTFNMMHAAKLAITDLEGPLTSREEQLFGMHMAEKIPVAGRGVRASGRAYNAFLTKMRADVFDHLIKGFQQQGVDVHDEKFLEGLGRYINASTGRGDLGHFSQAAPYLNTLFFSPRLLASRMNFLNPVFYARLPPEVRKEALRSALQLTGLVSTTLGLAAFAGAKVGRDPRNADFAKIKIGNTRLDILGGFQQPVRLLSQLTTGKIISSTTGDPLSLGPQGPGAVSRRDILQRFFEGKLAPTPSVVNDWFKGTDFQGQPFSWKKEAVQHMTPLLAQDAADLYNNAKGGTKGLAAAAAGYGVGAFGVGVQTYSDQSGQKKIGKYEKKIKALGIEESPQMREAIRLAGLRAAARAREKDNVHGRFKADLNVLVKEKVWTPQERAAALRTAAGMSEYTLAQRLKKFDMNVAFDPTGVLGRIDSEYSKMKRSADYGR